MTSEAAFPWAAPAEHERAWITIELDYPTNPWVHDGTGSITWGANFHRLAPLGEEAVSIIREAWEQRDEDLRDRAKREEEESVPVDRVPDTGASIRPGWAEQIQFGQYWIHLTLYRPVNERWEEKTVEGWMHGELVNDGIVERAVTVEATTNLGRRALRIIEALHSAHPYEDSEPQKLGPYPWG